jgi:thioredoxin 1
MNLGVARTIPMWRSSARFKPAVRITLMAAALVVSLLLLAGCGEAGSEGGVDSTVASSPSTRPPETSSPITAPGLPKLVDLGSVGCVPCDMMAGELDALALEYAGSVDVSFVDVNKTQEGAALANELGIQLIPTQVFFDPDGNELARHEGYISKEDIVQAFEELGFPLTESATSPGQETGSGDGG